MGKALNHNNRSGAGMSGGIGELDHFVQFYEQDDSLIDSLSSFVGTGLGIGEACVVVARETHLAGLDARLHAEGLDVAEARARGQYVTLDSAKTLSRLMVNGSPEPVRFGEVIGGLVTRTSEAWPRVRIYGDMVALLCGEGRHGAAVRLEELWNELLRARPFSLFCAYPMSNFGGEAHADHLGDVCASHTRVVPAESYTALTDPEERLRTVILLQQKARTLQAEIAERRQAEEDLRAVKNELEELLVREQMARAEAEAANRLKDEFLATVSHELRTPLTAIIGWSHMLKSGGLDETTKARAVEAVERNALAQAQLIEDILDVSRVITGKLRLDIAPVDASSVINAAIDSVQLAAEAKGIHLGVTLDAAARRVAGDAGRLQQVIWNLLSNAIKFTPTGGRVEVRLERAGTDARLSVSDTGEGIEPEFLPFIFDRFRQADGRITRRHGGLGLGLSIVRHLVEMHGGTVSAQSEGEGRGATFTITLPLAPERGRTKGRSRRSAQTLTEKTEPQTGAGLRGTLDGVRVLLVDDDRETLDMLSVVLSEHGGTVQAASSVAEAFEAINWYKPDVLVSDLAMPDEDGYDLVGRLRALEAAGGRRMPAVALTAHARVEDRVHALSAGFNIFIPKPVEPTELVTAIASLTEHART